MELRYHHLLIRLLLRLYLLKAQLHCLLLHFHRFAGAGISSRSPAISSLSSPGTSSMPARWWSLLKKASYQMSGESENPRSYIKVCLGSSCRRNGAPEIMAQLQAAFSQDQAFQVERYFCFGACNAGPNVVVIPEQLWFSFVIPAYIGDVVSAIHRGEELSSLARHVRPLIREAVLQSLEAQHAKLSEPTS